MSKFKCFLSLRAEYGNPEEMRKLEKAQRSAAAILEVFNSQLGFGMPLDFTQCIDRVARVDGLDYEFAGDLMWLQVETGRIRIGAHFEVIKKKKLEIPATYDLDPNKITISFGFPIIW